MILFETGSVELFSKLHSGTTALMQECHDNILMKLSAVRVKTAAERNVSTSRTGIPITITSSHVSSFTNLQIRFLERGRLKQLMMNMQQIK